jgi:hypothetical protein
MKQAMFHDWYNKSFLDKHIDLWIYHHAGKIVGRHGELLVGL